MNNTLKDNSNEENNLSEILKDSESEETNSFNFLLSLILRRKKFFILTLIIFSSFTLIRTTWEKIYNPIFRGDFSILIQDPIKQTSSDSFDQVGGIVSPNIFMGAATADLELDIKTLRELLLSELVLKDISKKYKLNTDSLASRISIKIDREATGILNFQLQSNDPKEDQSLLDDLSELYVNYAAASTKKRLSNGLDFLSDQEPSIKIKNSQLLEKLERFRREKTLLIHLLKVKN